MAYNPANQLALVFGGQSTNTGLLNDLWLTNGWQWLQYSTQHYPSPRSDASLAYDQARQVAVLFGGIQDGAFLDDTWVFNGYDWVEQHPTVRPPPRSGAKMVYDPIRELTYLFGGSFSFETTYQIYGDMWSWDGQTWKQLQPASLPLARSGAQMAFDPVRQEVVLFGGHNVAALLNDTWVWDGSSWSEAHPQHYPANPFTTAGMIFDEQRGQVILVGFSSASGQYRSQTWVWDGSDWIELLTYQTLPIEMSYGGELVYMPGLQSVMYFNAFRQKPPDFEAIIARSEVWALYPGYQLYCPQIIR